MLQAQKEQAKRLYAQSNHSNTAIAEAVGVNRQTLTFWVHEGNWQTLRHAARTMPSIVADKLYRIIDGVAVGILQDPYGLRNMPTKQAQTIHLLSAAIKKIKNFSTLNETMELFNNFMDGLRRRNPDLADKILPFVDEFIEYRGAPKVTDNLTTEFSPDGSIPQQNNEIIELAQDQADLKTINEEIEVLAQSHQTTPDDLLQQYEQQLYAKPIIATAAPSLPTQEEESPTPSARKNNTPSANKPTEAQEKNVCARPNTSLPHIPYIFPRPFIIDKIATGQTLYPKAPIRFYTPHLHSFPINYKKQKLLIPNQLTPPPSAHQATSSLPPATSASDS